MLEVEEVEVERVEASMNLVSWSPAMRLPASLQDCLILFSTVSGFKRCNRIPHSAKNHALDENRETMSSAKAKSCPKENSFSQEIFPYKLFGLKIVIQTKVKTE